MAKQTVVLGSQVWSVNGGAIAPGTELGSIEALTVNPVGEGAQPMNLSARQIADGVRSGRFMLLDEGIKPVAAPKPGPSAPKEEIKDA